jgi:hypothetical protein
MFGQYIYQLYDVERPKTVAEQRAADVRRGEIAAALSQQLRAITDLVRALSPTAIVRRAEPGTPPAALVCCPDAARDVLATASVSGGSADRHLSSDDSARPARVGC